MADTKAKKPIGKSATEFLDMYDKNTIVPRKIREGIAQLGEGWLTEIEFMRLCGINTTDIGRYREQFDEYVVLTSGRNGKRIWFGDTKLAAKMREKVA